MSMGQSGLFCLVKTIEDAEDASENLLPILIFNDSISVFKLEENTIIDNDLSVTTICKCKKPVFTLAKKILNWEPKCELKDGLLKTIEFIKKILNYIFI